MVVLIFSCFVSVILLLRLGGVLMSRRKGSRAKSMFTLQPTRGNEKKKVSNFSVQEDEVNSSSSEGITAVSSDLEVSVVSSESMDSAGVDETPDEVVPSVVSTCSVDESGSVESSDSIDEVGEASSSAFDPPAVDSSDVVTSLDAPLSDDVIQSVEEVVDCLTSADSDEEDIEVPVVSEEDRKTASDGKKKKTPFHTILIVLGLLMFLGYAGILGISALLESNMGNSGNGYDKGTISYLDFMQDLSEGEIDSVFVEQGDVFLTVVYKEGMGLDPAYDEVTDVVSEPNVNEDGIRVERLLNTAGEDFLLRLSEAGVEIGYRVVENSALLGLGEVFLTLGMYLIIFGVLSRMFSSMSPGGALMGSEFGTNVSKFGVDSNNVPKLSEVAGLEAEKKEFLFAVKTLLGYSTESVSRIEPTKGILLEGPPGTGKTMLTRAIAAETGMNFVYCSGSDFNGSFVALGAARVKAVFAEAASKAPCILFIDEFDALGAERVASNSAAMRDSNNTMATLLTEMDGVSPLKGVLVVGATNRVSDLDPAVLRPGRFDKTIHIDIPHAKKDIAAVVKIHMKDRKFDDTVTLERLTRLCFGLSGAEIAYVLNDAVAESLRRDANGVISMSDVSTALNKRLVGGVQKDTISERDKYRVAVHEAGHAIANLLFDRDVPEVSIQGYSSGVGGLTRVDAESANLLGLRTRTELLQDIKVLYAGRIAEEIILGEASVGASNDLERATQCLLQFSGVYGLSDSLLTQSVLNKVSPAMDPDYSAVDRFAHRLYDEVSELLSTESVKQAIEELADILLREKTVFSPTLANLAGDAV